MSCSYDTSLTNRYQIPYEGCHIPRFLPADAAAEVLLIYEYNAGYTDQARYNRMENDDVAKVRVLLLWLAKKPER